MFSLAKVYERRLQDNFRRHRVDGTIPARRPAPNCSPSIFKKCASEKPQAIQEPVMNNNNVVTNNSGDMELLNRFIRDSAVDQVKADEPIDHLEMDHAPEEENIAKPLAQEHEKSAGKGIHRVHSVESAFFTESESGLSA